MPVFLCSFCGCNKSKSACRHTHHASMTRNVQLADRVLFCVFLHLTQLKICLVICPLTAFRGNTGHGFRWSSQSLFCEYYLYTISVRKEISKGENGNSLQVQDTRWEVWILALNPYGQQDLFEGNYKILRESRYLTWLNADTSQATHRLIR